MTDLIRSTCDCGTLKTKSQGYMVCDHCDTPCGASHCPLCAAYKNGISRRLNLK